MATNFNFMNLKLTPKTWNRQIHTGIATPLLVMQSRISFRAWHRPAICNLSGTVRYKLFHHKYKIDQDQPKRKMTVTFYKWKNDKPHFGTMLIN